MNRWLWVLLAGSLLALDWFLLAFHRQDVLGNVEAQFIIITPQFVLSHVLHARRAERHHAERMAAHGRAESKLDALHQHLGVQAEAASPE